MIKAVEPSKIYLISYQAIGKDKFFYSDENYLTFLKNYATFLLPMMHTYAYCLLPTKMQWLVKIKEDHELFSYLKANFKIPEETLRFEEYKTLSDSTSALVGNLFGLQINKQIAALFKAYFADISSNQTIKIKAFNPVIERNEIEKDSMFNAALISLHISPEINAQVEKYEAWKYSSYAAYLSDKPSSIERNHALELFVSKENFIVAHQLELEKHLAVGLKTV